MSNSKRRGLLMLLLSVLGASAFYGGVQLIRDAFALPPDWIQPLPFDSWVVPGLLLMSVLGIPAFATLGMYVADNPFADRLAVVVGLLVMGWVVGQLFFIPLTWLQPLVFAVGLSIVLLAVVRIRDVR